MKVSRSRKIGLEICMDHSWDDEETTDDGRSKGANEASVPGAKVVSDWGVEAKDQKLAITGWIAGLSHLKARTSKEQEGKWFRMSEESKGDKYPPPGPEACRSWENKQPFLEKSVGYMVSRGPEGMILPLVMI